MDIKKVPNILTVIRMALVPVFMALIVFPILPTDTWVRVVGATLFAIISFTDFLDGKIARKYNCVSDFGKFLDPIADKLMQGALLLSLVLGGLLPWPFAIPFVAKELAQALLGFLMLRRRQFVVVSRWFGKVALTLFHLAVNFTVIAAAIFVPMPWLANALLGVFWILTLGFMIYAFVSYLVGYAMLAAKIKKEWREAPVAPQ